MCSCFSADAVAITWTDRVIPSLTWIVPFGISASLFSKLLINVFEWSRITYIAGQEGQLPLLFNMLNIYSSPFMSILLLATMASIAIVLTNLIDLINYIYFAVSIWTIFSLTGILKLRYQEPHLPRPYKVKVIFLIFFLYEIKDIGYRNSHCGAMGLAVPLEIWYIGSVPSPTQWFKDLEFPPLWYRSQLQLGLDLWPRNFICHRGTTTSNTGEQQQATAKFIYITTTTTKYIYNM